MSGLCRHSPSLLLLDEPTSGLDSRAALFLLTTLRQLAKTRAVALTIHQPGGKLWALLHQATLLSAQGQTIYFGPSRFAAAHFERIGLPKPDETSVAEHLLDLAADSEDLGIVSRLAAFGPAARPMPPVEYAAVSAHQSFGIEGSLSDHTIVAPSSSLTPNRAQGVGQWEQFRVLLWRARVQNARNPAFVRALSGRTIAMSLVVGALFSGVGTTQQGAQDRAGALYFILTTQVMSSSASLRTFLAERAIAQHEVSKHKVGVELIVYNTSMLLSHSPSGKGVGEGSWCN